MKASQKSHL